MEFERRLTDPGLVGVGVHAESGETADVQKHDDETVVLLRVKWAKAGWSETDSDREAGAKQCLPG